VAAGRNGESDHPTYLPSGSYSAAFYHIDHQSLYGTWHRVYEEEDPCPAVLRYLEPLASLPASVTLP
jgi:hypothetical protein